MEIPFIRGLLTTMKNSSIYINMLIFTFECTDNIIYWYLKYNTLSGARSILFLLTFIQNVSEVVVAVFLFN